MNHDTQIKNDREIGSLIDTLLDGELSGIKLRAFMDNKLYQLSLCSTVKRVGCATSCTDLINHNVPIVSEGELSKEFFLDDDSMYSGLEDRLVDIYKRIIGKMPNIAPAEAYFRAAILATQYQLVGYFNNMIVGNRNERGLLLADLVTSDDNRESFSISELKSVAMCMERSAVAHNMLKILGVESTLEVGELEINHNGHKEGHAWLVVEDKDGEKYIFDPLNCHRYKDDSGAILKIKPLIVKYNGEREEKEANHITYARDGSIMQSNELRYYFASQAELDFASRLLGR